MKLHLINRDLFFLKCNVVVHIVVVQFVVITKMCVKIFIQSVSIVSCQYYSVKSVLGCVSYCGYSASPYAFKSTWIVTGLSALCSMAAGADDELAQWSRFFFWF